MSVENPVIKAMLEELRAEYPELWPLMQRCIETPPCLALLPLLDCVPRQWLTLRDLAGKLGQGENTAQVMLSCLIEQQLVTRLEIRESGEVFYRLTDDKSEREKVANFQSWRRRWRARLTAANQLLGQDCQWGEDR
jgi:DNA-binding IclR family transcriptional regulator